MLQHEQQEKLIEELSKSFSTKINNILTKLEVELINSILESNPSPQFKYTVLKSLEKVGYYQAINELINKDFDLFYESIKKGFVEAGFDINFIAEDIEQLLVLKQIELDRYQDFGNELVSSLTKSMLQQSIGGQSKAQMIKTLKEELVGSRLSRYAETIVRTSLGEFQQAVIDMKAKDLDGVWIYVGSNDKLTRDFCRDVLNDKRAYTDAEKQEIQNDKRREFNCRHRFRMISKQRAKDRGYKL